VLGMVIKLNELPEGSKAIIERVELPEGLRERILGMGFIPGKMVEAIKKAPLVDPTVYKVGNFRVSLRSSEASKIYVKPIGPIPLVLCPTNVMCRIVALNGGRRFLNNLKSVGIDVGRRIKILNNEFGRLSMEVDGKVYTIGRGMASKIVVEVLR